ncbi:MAG: tyrosine-type recombinase/integrase [Bacteroidales bacterium]|nr:tyrosine-type recombinase/integrase [Bacteroidales bacterium]
MIINQFLEYLQYERSYSTHTVLSYRNDLSQFVEFIRLEQGEFILGKIDSDIIRLWIVALMEQKRSTTTVKRKLSALKSFYRFLLKRGIVTKNPIINIAGPKSGKEIPSFVKESEMDFLLEKSSEDTNFESLRDNAIMHLFYATGIRRAELLNLKDSDVDFFTSVIKVTGKRNKQRIIPLGEEIKQLLLNYLEERDVRIGVGDGHLFVKSDGEALYPMLVHRIVSERLSITNISKKSPHVLRHTFATSMLNNGAQLNAVKELLGHSSLASTEVYTHTSFEELKRSYNSAHPRAIHFKKGG